MRPRHSLVIAAALVYAIGNYVPYGHELLYPLMLFTTWVHEMGHGMTALAVGGSFSQLEIFRNGSGLASCAADPGWRSALVSAGGLLAPPIVGSALIAFAHGPKRARLVLIGLAAALVLSLVLYVRSATGIIAMPIVALALGACAWPLFGDAPERRVVVVQALGVVLGLDTMTRMVSYAFESEVEINGVKMHSDIQAISDNLGGSYVVWGAIITAIAVGAISLALWWSWRRPEPRVTAPRA